MLIAIKLVGDKEVMEDFLYKLAAEITKRKNNNTRLFEQDDHMLRACIDRHIVSIHVVRTEKGESLDTDVDAIICALQPRQDLMKLSDSELSKTNFYYQGEDPYSFLTDITTELDKQVLQKTTTRISTANVFTKIPCKPASGTDGVQTHGFGKTIRA